MNLNLKQSVSDSESARDAKVSQTGGVPRGVRKPSDLPDPTGAKNSALWGRFGESFFDEFCALPWGPFWDHFGPFWDHLGTIVGPFFDPDFRYMRNVKMRLPPGREHRFGLPQSSEKP